MKEKMSTHSYRQVEFQIMQWAEARGIYKHGKPVSQLLKAVSEMGELADAEGKNNLPEVKDAVGDILVCLINYCVLKDIDMIECLEGAYQQIKDRKGTLMPDGTFVKA